MRLQLQSLDCAHLPTASKRFRCEGIGSNRNLSETARLQTVDFRICPLLVHAAPENNRWEALRVSPGSLSFDPGGFGDARCVFTLAHHKASELRLCHAHGIASMFHKPVAQIWRC